MSLNIAQVRYYGLAGMVYISERSYIFSFFPFTFKAHWKLFTLLESCIGSVYFSKDNIEALLAGSGPCIEFVASSSLFDC